MCLSQSAMTVPLGNPADLSYGLTSGVVRVSDPQVHQPHTPRGDMARERAYNEQQDRRTSALVQQVSPWIPYAGI